MIFSMSFKNLWYKKTFLNSFHIFVNIQTQERRFILTRSQFIHTFVHVLQIVILPVSKSRNFILRTQIYILWI